jgi:hypothetical protein
MVLVFLPSYVAAAFILLTMGNWKWNLKNWEQTYTLTVKFQGVGIQKACLFVWNYSHTARFEFLLYGSVHIETELRNAVGDSTRGQFLYDTQFFFI